MFPTVFPLPYSVHWSASMLKCCHSGGSLARALLLLRVWLEAPGSLCQHHPFTLPNWDAASEGTRHIGCFVPKGSLLACSQLLLHIHAALI